MTWKAPAGTSFDPSLSGSRSPSLLYRSWVVLPLLVCVAVLPYVNSLNGSFHFDDEWAIVRNESIRSWAGMAEHSLGRWLTYFTYYVNYSIHGLDFMPGWHLVNIALHAACVLGLYGTLRLVMASAGRGNSPAPFIAALLFAVHPLASEPVNYIRARGAMIYTMLTLTALCGAVMAHQAKSWPPRVAGIVLAVIAICLAAITKEVAGFFALAAPSLYVAAFVGPAVIGRKRTWLVIGSVVALVGLGAWVWSRSSGSLTWLARFTSHPLAGQHFWAMTTVFWRYVSLAIWPAPGRLSVDHYVPYHPSRVYSFGDADVMPAIAGILVLLGVAIWLVRRRPAVSVFLMVPLMGILPYFVVTTIDVLVEYKFYLPLTGMCALAGLGLARLWRAKPVAGRALVLGLCLAMGLATASRNVAWRTELSLWEDAAQKGPRKARTINVLAWILATDEQAKDPPRALRLARRSFDTDYVDPWWGYDPHLADTLAEAHYANGLYDQAVRIEQEIVRRGIGPTWFFRRQLDKFEKARRRGRSTDDKAMPASH
ncbi:MAG: hypothetical protein ACYS8X_05500 [Planctomycetota bacterium]|jgi:hypothetical protein